MPGQCPQVGSTMPWCGCDGEHEEYRNHNAVHFFGTGISKLCVVSWPLIGLVAWESQKVTYPISFFLPFLSLSFFLSYLFPSFFFFFYPELLSSPLSISFFFIVPFPCYSVCQILAMEVQYCDCEWGSGIPEFKSGLCYFLVVKSTQASYLTLHTFISSPLKWRY